MNKCVTFDFDGTIADTRSIFTDIYNNILVARYGGRRVSEDDIEKLRKFSLYKKLRYLKVSPLKIPLFVKAARSEVSKRIKHFPLFDGIDTVMVNLKKKGYTIAVISTNRRKNVRRFLELKNITVVDHIYSDIGASLFVKGRTIKRFLRKKRIAKKNFVYIGDELRDVEACKKVGVKIVAVSWGWDSLEAIKKGNPDFVAHEPKDIEIGVQEILGGED